MHSSIELTTSVYRSILSHLVGIEERKDEIVNEFYSEATDLRNDFNLFLDNYVEKLDKLVRSVQVVEKPNREKLNTLNYLPYVIIGSVVELESLNARNKKVFRIISPYDFSNSKDDLSYVSELGKDLMLKAPGDLIDTEIDSEPYSYRVKSIRYEG